MSACVQARLPVLEARPVRPLRPRCRESYADVIHAAGIQEGWIALAKVCPQLLSVLSS